MLIAIFGENCSGKSTLAEMMKQSIGAKVMSGKDYLRLARSESEAQSLFRKMLLEAVEGENLIFVCSEPEQLALLPQGARRIYVKAELETIKERFRARMHGKLPPPVEAMLERKHGMFENEAHELIFDGTAGDAQAFCAAAFENLKKRLKARALRRLTFIFEQKPFQIQLRGEEAFFKACRFRFI